LLAINKMDLRLFLCAAFSLSSVVEYSVIDLWARGGPGVAQQLIPTQTLVLYQSSDQTARADYGGLIKTLGQMRLLPR